MESSESAGGTADRAVSAVPLFRRLSCLAPVLLVLLLVIAADRVVLAVVGSISDQQQRSFSRFLEYARAANRERPHLIVIGSSRGQDGVDVDILQQEVDAAGLPHQVFNLSLGGGGTPSLLYAALKDLTPALERLPPDSKVIYVFSHFEMNFLNASRMLLLPTGRLMLARFGLVKEEGWVYRLAHVSGFARAVETALWQEAPLYVWRVLEVSISPISLQRQDASCNKAGLVDYQIMPINDWALGELIRRLGDQLTLVAPPVSDRQIQDDKRHGLDRIGGDYMRRVEAETGVRYLADASRWGVPDTAFAANCDHLTDASNKRQFARSLVAVIR